MPGKGGKVPWPFPSVGPAGLSGWLWWCFLSLSRLGIRCKRRLRRRARLRAAMAVSRSSIPRTVSPMGVLDSRVLLRSRRAFLSVSHSPSERGWPWRCVWSLPTRPQGEMWLVDWFESRQVTLPRFQAWSLCLRLRRARRQGKGLHLPPLPSSDKHSRLTPTSRSAFWRWDWCNRFHWSSDLTGPAASKRVQRDRDHPLSKVFA